MGKFLYCSKVQIKLIESEYISLHKKFMQNHHAKITIMCGTDVL